MSNQSPTAAALRRLFAAACDVVLVLDAQGGYVSIAGPDTALYKPPVDLVGRTLHEILPAEQAELFLQHVRRAIDEGRMHRVEYCLPIGGREFWFDGSVSPMSKNSVLWLARDITKTKRAEEELRHQLRFTEAITTSLGEGIYALDQHGQVAFLNPAAETALGWKESEVLGRNMHAAIHYQCADGTPVPASECPILTVLRTGKTVKIDRDVFSRKDGAPFPVSYTASAIRSDDQVVGAVLAFHDITERCALEEQLRQAQKMEAVGELAGGIAHDFNNLLTIINGYADVLLARENTGDTGQNELRAIKSAGERAAQLTQRLLAFGRRQMLHPQIVSLNAIISGVEPMLCRLIPEDIDVAVHLNPEAGLVKADPAQLEQVILNLAVNARDAMLHGGKLTLETAPVELDETYAHSHPEVTPGRYALLVVTDTGVGMTEEVRAHIFEPFFTTKEAGKGTGLGLSMAYGVVRQSGGHIWVYSEPDAGTSFKIYLPLVDEEPQTVGTHARDSVQPRGKETILLVEDDSSLREYVAHLLAAQGYTVIESSNGEEALAQSAAVDGGIDLLISDVVMPGMSVANVATELTKRRPRLKVLYMSGYAGDAIVRHGILNEGVAFLAKPFSPEALARKVREVLDAPQERKPGHA